MLIEIKNDVYFVLERLKEIDKKYLIFYNAKRKVFEIHNKGQIGGSYCLTVPYKTLDSRTIDLVKKTRVENSKKIFAEIDAENERINLKNQKKIINQAEKILKKI